MTPKKNGRGQKKIEGTFLLLFMSVFIADSKKGKKFDYFFFQSKFPKTGNENNLYKQFQIKK